MATVREALALYHRQNGFKGDSYYSETIQIRMNGEIADLPNFAFQRGLIARHDLHHVLTGYSTDLRGEAEMGAWEIGAGSLRWKTTDHVPRPDRGPERFALGAIALLYMGLNNVGALFLGVIAPWRTLRAFVRGLRSRSLYADDTPYETLLSSDLDVLRNKLGIAR
jgi:hypothetical protein